MSAPTEGQAPAVAPGTATQPGDPGTPGAEAAERSAGSVLQSIARSNVLVVVLAFVFAFVVGSVLILVSDVDVRAAAGYFLSRPGDLIGASWTAITEAYAAMFRGAVFDLPGARKVAGDIAERGGSGLYLLIPAFLRGIKPLLETLTVATPLIIASVGMAVSFRSGLFNIGGTGQLIVGATAAGYVGFAVDLPVVIHLLACILAAIVAGGLYGGVAGFLKARFGASEVITTIMLNWIATYALAFALTTSAFTGANKAQPTSPSIAGTARLPLLAGDQYRLHLGLVIALLAVIFLWWLMSRSTLGFRFRAVGSNPRAAEVAGIDVGRSAIGVMVVAGALVGLAGGVHVLGTEQRLTGSIAGSIGFDAITVALLGRSGPVGILLAGVLFAGLSTGGRFMESAQGVPIDLVQVIQALVVLFIAAPPLVRFLVGLGGVDRPRAPRRRTATGAHAAPVLAADAAAVAAAEGPAAPREGAHRAPVEPAAGDAGDGGAQPPGPPGDPAEPVGPVDSADPADTVGTDSTVDPSGPDAPKGEDA
ncbi:ABC transporter permease [Brachybacterium squillarum]|uniref:ABC transporter permease n=1 Tax=Brachybacterium squillarum TaxID=661979 RepID=UPI0022227211|nr:ABC transporter permease [Brachybacterium squillarum]MCW1806109.1 ABC transporter permease [Brachybacterium squillarum]